VHASAKSELGSHILLFRPSFIKIIMTPLAFFDVSMIAFFHIGPFALNGIPKYLADSI
jgi:hypothetical protein